MSARGAGRQAACHGAGRGAAGGGRPVGGAGDRRAKRQMPAPAACTGEELRRSPKRPGAPDGMPLDSGIVRQASRVSRTRRRAAPNQARVRAGAAAARRGAGRGAAAARPVRGGGETPAGRAPPWAAAACLAFPHEAIPRASCRYVRFAHRRTRKAAGAPACPRAAQRTQGWIPSPPRPHYAAGTPAVAGGRIVPALPQRPQDPSPPYPPPAAVAAGGRQEAWLCPSRDLARPRRF